MVNDKPRVSIGLPVYNGEKYLEKALDSILSQTYTDFELIISDNASVDRTQEICLKYTNKDQRISYFRNEKNLGAAWNFNRVFALSAGEYFTWAAYDDIEYQDFLFKCIEVLDNDSTVVKCFSKVKVIDEFGKCIRNHDSGLCNVNSTKPNERFGDLIRLDHWCIDIFGLIRSDSLRKTSLMNQYPGADRALLAEIGLLGRFHEIPEYLFFNRDHPDRSIRACTDLQKSIAWWNPAKAGHNAFPYWSLFYQYLRSVNHFPLSLNERLYCYKHLGKWTRLYYRKLIKDLIISVLPIHHSIE